MFFAKPGEYDAAELYGIEHGIILLITIFIVLTLVYFTKNKKSEEVKKIIRILTVIMWILELIKIIFNIFVGNVKNINTYVPLYFCSIILYAGIFSGFCTKWLKRTGDVFLATGSFIAGTIFLICPNTSLSIYPIFHYISIQSFILHGIMVYLGILVNVTRYINIKVKDIIYYSGLIGLISLIALIFNEIFDSNLMFISKDFPGTPIHILYELSGSWFTFFMIILQASLPFFLMKMVLEACTRVQKKK